MARIPVCQPFLNGNELTYATDAIKTNWISSGGRYIELFEKKFSRYVAVKYGIATTNGTAALHLAMIAAGIKKGDEVIVPDFTMISPVFAICYIGAMPVFIDADPDTWTINPGKIAERITPRTKAIIAVHIYGHPVDMDPVLEIARRHKLIVLEDASEAHGARYKNKKCGSLSCVSAFSFYANKIITTGEGGMVLTDNYSIAKRSRYYKNLCFSVNGDRDYVHRDIGFNYRMGNLQAAIGLAQLEKHDEYLALRRKNAKLYNLLLKDVGLLTLPIEKEWARSCYWMYGAVLSKKAKISRERLMKRLLDVGIETRPFFVPMHLQPSLRQYGADCSDSYPVSKHLGERGFYLPSSSNLKEEEIGYICRCLKKMLR